MMQARCVGSLVLCLACSDHQPQKQAAPPPQPSLAPINTDSIGGALDTAGPPVDTVLGECAVVLRGATADEQQVVDALKKAYGLEDALFQEHRTTDSISRDEVYAHYRRGFAEKLAQRLTDYSWQAGMLRPTERALAIPDSVGVLELKSDRAELAWITPTMFRTQWGMPRCQVDRLVREDGRWIVQPREP